MEEVRERKSGRGYEFQAIGLVRSAVTGSEGDGGKREELRSCREALREPG
jgi:hypothetical protein